MISSINKLLKKFYADECVYDALKSDKAIVVKITKKSIQFIPTREYNVGIIYYPGGRVEAQSFANSARYFAKAGYFVSLEKMPCGLAMMDIDRALKIKQDYKNIKTWVLAGFSLGGVSAIYHVERHLNEYDGLILYGSYPSEKMDISKADVKVLQLIGELDGFSPIEKAEERRKHLPKDTETYIIKGGNHVQFAEYNNGRAYDKDNIALITRDRQQEIIRMKTIEFIQSL